MKEFSPTQFIIVNTELGAITDELGYVDRPLGGPFYEVVLLKDHEVESGYDPIRVVSSGNMRSATKEEISEKKRQWQEEHGHNLPFGIREDGNINFITSVDIV